MTQESGLLHMLKLQRATQQSSLRAAVSGKPVSIRGVISLTSPGMSQLCWPQRPPSQDRLDALQST